MYGFRGFSCFSMYAFTWFPIPSMNDLPIDLPSKQTDLLFVTTKAQNRMEKLAVAYFRLGSHPSLSATLRCLFTIQMRTFNVCVRATCLWERSVALLA